MFSHLRRTLFKICKLIVFNIWFLSFLRNLRQFDLKKRKKRLFTNTVCILFYLCSLTDPNQSVFLTWCGFYNNWSPSPCDEYTHISETQIWQLRLIFANNRFPLQPVEAEHTKKENRTSWQQLHAQENKILVLCAVGPLRKQSHHQRESEEKLYVPKV